MKLISLASLAVAGLIAFSGQAQQQLHHCRLTQAQQEVLNLLEVVQIPDGQGGTVQALRVQSNLQIVNTLGSTETTNGLGNLILGYNEETGTDIRTGSHNLVLGVENDWSSYGGVVAGVNNGICGAYANVLGGTDNEAEGAYAVVVGGDRADALGDYSVTAGGLYAYAQGRYSAIFGGDRAQIVNSVDETESEFAVIVGGSSNAIFGSEYSAILGGDTLWCVGDPSFAEDGYNVLAGGQGQTIYNAYYSSIFGGWCNNVEALGSVSLKAGTVLGGEYNIIEERAGGGLATDQSATIVGGRTNYASGFASLATGGRLNEAHGDFATVSGGSTRSAVGTDDWAAGSLFEDD